MIRILRPRTRPVNLAAPESDMSARLPMLAMTLLIALALIVVAVWKPRPHAEPKPVPLAYAPPKGYVCYRASGPISIDGKLDDVAWNDAPWTDDFVDIEGELKPKPPFRTRVKMLWDDANLYIAAELEEPHVWATLREHDSVIFRDPDFEVFIDPDGDNHLYGELELNPFNTTWDLLLSLPYRDGGRAVNGWEIMGLRTAVRIDGTINNAGDTDN